MSKITKATFKKFVKQSGLFIKTNSDFDGMADCVVTINSDFRPAKPTLHCPDHTLFYSGIWLVGGGRDYFSAYEDAQFKGISCCNSCGSFIVAIKK
jgi:hypothetical protein